MPTKYQSEAEYYLVRGWFESTSGIHEGTFYGARVLPDNPLQYIRTVIYGPDAQIAAARAASTPRIYSRELIEEKERSARPPLTHKKFANLDVTIENPAGTIRSGKDKDGHEWSIKMKNDYGFLRKVESGMDGDGVDVYLGPNESAKNIYVIHQNDPTTGKFDEDKVMLGFDSGDEAKRTYLDHYDRPDFFGSMTEIPMETFVEAVDSKGDAFKWKSKNPQVGVKLDEMVASGGIADRPVALGGTLGIKDQEVLFTRDDRPKRKRKKPVPKLPHRNKIGPRIPTLNQAGGQLGGKSR